MQAQSTNAKKEILANYFDLIVGSSHSPGLSRPARLAPSRSLPALFGTLSKTQKYI